jgi:hypothetical protein
MPKKKDELDPAAARRFAWGMMPADTLAEDEPSAPSGVEAEDDGEAADEADSAAPAAPAAPPSAPARAAGPRLAEGLRRVWEVDGEAAQAGALASLLATIPAGARFMALADFRGEAVMLARLAIRLRPWLDEATAKAIEDLSVMTNLSGPQAGELALEIARAGDWGAQCKLILSLGPGRDVDVPSAPDFGARLGQILDDGATWDARDLAAIFAGMTRDRGIVPALRRALRSRSLAIRWRALESLEARFPDAIEPDDVLGMLRDADEHPVRDGGSKQDDRLAMCDLPALLAKVTTRLAPPGGAEVLARIARFESASDEASLFDPWWALVVLAAAYPREAIALVDERLRSNYFVYRAYGVDAAARLPEAEARPRLRGAAADGCPDVSVRAADAWRARFGEPCPVDELACLDLGLLDAPPSQKLRDRALALRGPREARQKLAAVLLAEAPDPEALVLFVAALADDVLLPFVADPAIPLPLAGDIARVVAERFGARGVRGLCALAARYRDRRFGWLHALAELLEEHAELVGPAERATLRGLAEAELVRGDALPYKALRVLRWTGTASELEPALWSIALAPGRAAFDDSAAKALVAQGGPGVEQRALAELRGALAAGDVRRLTQAAKVGLGRGLSEARALATEGLAAACELGAIDRDLAVRLAHLATRLDEAHGLPSEWVTAHLARPETAGFAVAAVLAGGRRQPTAREAALLREALSSTARGGAAAAEAAEALLRSEALSPRSRKLPPIFVAAPLALRARLLKTMAYLKAPMPDAVWPAIEELLTSDDPDVHEELRFGLHHLPWKRWRARLVAVLPRVSAPKLEESLRDELKVEEPSYWRTMSEPVAG